jgi:nitrite reductase/ring-hydroxylating ferredoxin subunit
MLSHEQNERLVRVGRGTPAGELFRRYWQPACLSQEVPIPDGAPIRVRLLGEDLVCFRDTNGRVGLVDAFCPHRRAPLFFGRNEECGLRCVYHGWKFDVGGACGDLPSEPLESRMKSNVKITAYPTAEKAGIVWAYLGPPDLIPPLPDYEWMRAPTTHGFVSKTYEECNYLQALEGGLSSRRIMAITTFRRGTLEPKEAMSGSIITSCRFSRCVVDYGDSNPKMRFRILTGTFGFRSTMSRPMSTIGVIAPIPRSPFPPNRLKR